MIEIVSIDKEYQPPDRPEWKVISMRTKIAKVRKIRLKIDAPDFVVCWGDGQTDKRVTHVYKNDGRYRIEIRVKDIGYLNVGGCYLYELDVGQITTLKILICYNNSLCRLDLSGLGNLEFLDCCNNGLRELDLRRNAELYKLNCGRNQLVRLCIEGCKQLKFLICSMNQLKRLNAEGCEGLRRIECCQNDMSEKELYRMMILLPRCCPSDSGHIRIWKNPGAEKCEVGRFNMRGWNVDDCNFYIDY
ncbi:leucine-rich repeat domain-containing protein [Culturomica massiliensis]|uniref:leucine-rich repeat domain-containing protein n=1 Tax=Culturomica massiliensis TaxID=1841857 RepID=UPI0011C42E7C|nr:MULTISPECIES: leucine-rich repeat domain-containing protein [Odoribacteraceae]